MRQLGIQGEVQWGALRKDSAHLDFNVSRPGSIDQIQADLALARVNITHTRYNGWGIARTLHTFIGVSPTRNYRAWVLTSVWALSMDAIALGIIVMVLGSFYMWWQLKDKRLPGLIALTLGTAVCLFFVSGLRWFLT